MSEQIDKLWDCVYRIGNAFFEMGYYKDNSPKNLEARERLREARERLRNEWIEFEEFTNEVEELKILCKELLNGADKCSQKPHYIVQPFLGIVKRYSKIIEKYKLLG